ncbi:MAG TPA: GNAT family N-acetyltransferase [Bacteroidota bacterium]|nr:GNAT family N-acetyltransferase [Bacteroidota bacterium]
MNITIRPATVNDASIIADFNALMAEETEGRLLDRNKLMEGVRSVLTDASKGVYYVAEIDGAVVGQLMITYEWSDWRSGNFWWIQSVYVRKEHRGKRIFRALFDHVMNMAKARKDVCGVRLYVEKHNRRAREAYEKLGMKKTAYRLYEIDFVL